MALDTPAKLQSATWANYSWSPATPAPGDLTLAFQRQTVTNVYGGLDIGGGSGAGDPPNLLLLGVG